MVIGGWLREVRNVMVMMTGRVVGSLTICTPKGYLPGGDETDEIEMAITQLIEDGNTAMIIKLSETQHLNSTALGVLISAHSNYVRRGGQMKLAAVDKRIENIFVITKPSLVFDAYPTEEQAIASFADREPV